MKILVINSGSSSVKSQLFENKEFCFKGHIDGIGTKNCRLTTKFDSKTTETPAKVKNHKEALELLINSLKKLGAIKHFRDIDAIGHRVVHGGELYSEKVIIDNKVIKDIKELIELAPLHNPANLEGILACKEVFGNIVQVAVFDTGFHSTIKQEIYRYALPKEYYEKYKIRKYGFHGTSFRYISKQMHKKHPEIKKMILCHLGNGSSICAVKNGESINTSMGFTPLAGVVMGTRSGDIDPSLVGVIKNKTKKNCHEVITTLNKESGLKGICGYSDMRSIWSRIRRGNHEAKLALDILSNSITKYISEYITDLQGTNAIVFSAGIGEKAWYLREKVIKNFEYLGIELDEEANKENKEIISSHKSSVKVLIIPTDEEWMIADLTEKLVLQKTILKSVKE